MIGRRASGARRAAHSSIFALGEDRTFFASGPFAPSAPSKSTFAPSASVLKPSPPIALWWTKTSLPPASGVINPYPFASLNHLTIPVAMKNTSPARRERAAEAQKRNQYSLVVVPTLAAAGCHTERCGGDTAADPPPGRSRRGGFRAPSATLATGACYRGKTRSWLAATSSVPGRVCAEQAGARIFAGSARRGRASRRLGDRSGREPAAIPEPKSAVGRVHKRPGWSGTS